MIDNKIAVSAAVIVNKINTINCRNGRYNNKPNIKKLKFKPKNINSIARRIKIKETARVIKPKIPKKEIKNPKIKIFIKKKEN
jgi:hypothetical protein